MIRQYVGMYLIVRLSSSSLPSSSRSFSHSPRSPSLVGRQVPDRLRMERWIRTSLESGMIDPDGALLGFCSPSYPYTCAIRTEVGGGIPVCLCSSITRTSSFILNTAMIAR